MKYYLILFISILFEIFATSMLKLSDGFTNLIPSIALVIGFGISFTLLIISLKFIPLSVAYSIWAGLGTAGTALVGMFLFNEILSGLNVFGLMIIIVGVVIMNLEKKSDNLSSSNAL
ncbi:DMT family transporter [Nosocomiicoccus ampullae]|uniref:DMT family transporter n=1 Tax=Nosocomiicoccus ampullae TaxID=489910 RepID=UPI0008A5A7F0|nr:MULTISPECIES: multidrug efflux SMR transporter [Nosocomiicoccus]MDK6863983.1 multidrug efflux SMR transporter [Nosocomiicoccus ampullae]OFO55061.1 multidrug transporter [Nosocomiicoccus sp. HMSC059G07]QYA48102.1 multidrug efflux SMR transporter [Nosocomiicoccus ampullae]